MPSRELHRELNRLFGVEDPRMEIQRLMDSTAREHGPGHRADAIHEIHGLVAELARRGQLTPERVKAAAAHLAEDRLWDAVQKRLPVRGPLREPVKKLIEASLVQALRRRRRR